MLYTVLFYFMLVLLAYLTISWKISTKFVPPMSNDDEDNTIQLFPMDLFHEHLNDLLNDGLNRTTFFKFFTKNPLLYFVYNSFIDLITNQNFIIKHKYANKISTNLNVDQNLYSISTEIREWYLNNKKEFIELKPIISVVGPHLCTAFNLDYDVLYSLYDYIFVNEANDGVVI